MHSSLNCRWGRRPLLLLAIRDIVSTIQKMSTKPDQPQPRLRGREGDIYKLSKILGHSSVAVTEAHDAHLLKEDLVSASQQVKIPVAPRETGNAVGMPRPARN